MFSQRVRNVMEQEGLLIMAPEGLVSEAARRMGDSPYGAVLVVQGGVLQGIFTQSDAVRRVMAKGLDPRQTPLAAVMSSPVHTVAPDWQFGRALQLLHDRGLRQAPVLERGVPVGMLRSRDALDPEMEEFACEVQRREGYSRESPAALPEPKR